MSMSEFPKLPFKLHLFLVHNRNNSDVTWSDPLIRFWFIKFVTVTHFWELANIFPKYVWTFAEKYINLLRTWTNILKMLAINGAPMCIWYSKFKNLPEVLRLVINTVLKKCLKSLSAQLLVAFWENIQLWAHHR